MTEPQTIYVRLLEEGVDVWRPVPAYQVDNDTFILLRPIDYDASVEHWEFPPGTAIEAEPKQLEGSQRLIATRPARLMSRTA